MDTWALVRAVSFTSVCPIVVFIMRVEMGSPTKPCCWHYSIYILESVCHFPQTSHWCMCREVLWEVPPVTRSWRKYRAGKPSRIRDPPGWPQPLPHPVSSPPFLLLFLFALLQILVLPAESSPAPLSLNEDQLKTLLNKSPGRCCPMKEPGMKEMLQFKHFSGILACVINVWSHCTKCSWLF